MYNNQITVDVHGHMTTPAVFRQFLAETRLAEYAEP